MSFQVCFPPASWTVSAFDISFVIFLSFERTTYDYIQLPQHGSARQPVFPAEVSRGGKVNSDLRWYLCELATKGKNRWWKAEKNNDVKNHLSIISQSGTQILITLSRQSYLKKIKKNVVFEKQQQFEPCANSSLLDFQGVVTTSSNISRTCHRPSEHAVHQLLVYWQPPPPQYLWYSLTWHFSNKQTTPLTLSTC